MLQPQPFLRLRPPSSSSPCLLPSSYNFLYSFRPRRFHFLSPCSSLKQSKKQQPQQTLKKTNAPQSFPRLFSPKDDDDGEEKVKGDDADGLEGDTAVKGTLLAGVLLVGVVGGFATVGYVYKDQINAFLNQFSTFIEGISD